MYLVLVSFQYLELSLIKIGIFTATWWELNAVRRALPSFHFSHISGARGFVGQGPNNIHVAVCQTGMGIHNAAKNCQAVLSLDKWDLVVSTGFIGALTSAHIGDILIASKVLVYDNSVPEGALFPCHDGFQEKACRIAKKLRMPSLRGPVISVSRVVGRSTEKRQLAEQSEAVGVDMESAGIGSVAHEYRVPFLVVRVVSDLVEEDLPMDFNVFQGRWGWIGGMKNVLFYPRVWFGLVRFTKQTFFASDQITRFFLEFLDNMKADSLEDLSSP